MLRYPIHAVQILRLADAQWTSLQTTRIEATLQLLAATDRLGVFVTAAPAVTR